MTKIPLKLIKRPKYPQNLKITKIPHKPKKMTKILPKPIKWPKYPRNLKLSKYPLNLKDNWNTSKTYKMTKIPLTSKNYQNIP